MKITLDVFPYEEQRLLFRHVLVRDRDMYRPDDFTISSVIHEMKVKLEHQFLAILVNGILDRWRSAPEKIKA